MELIKQSAPFFCLIYPYLDCSVECSWNNLKLVLAAESDEVNSISWNTDSKLWILLRMCLSVEKCLTCENVYVKVVAALLYVAVEQSNQVIYLVLCCCHNCSFLVFSDISPVFCQTRRIAYTDSGKSTWELSQKNSILNFFTVYGEIPKILIFEIIFSLFDPKQ